MPKRDFVNQEYKDRKGMVYVDVSDAVSGLYRFANFTRAEVKLAAKEYAKEVVDYMQKNAPWQDRTGEARRKLTAEYFEQGGVNTYLNVGVKLKHGVKYGVFLEYNGLYHTAYLSRRRPILVPTMQATMSTLFLEKIRKSFSKIAKQMR